MNNCQRLAQFYISIALLIGIVLYIGLILRPRINKNTNRSQETKSFVSIMFQSLNNDIARLRSEIPKAQTVGVPVGHKQQ